MPDMHTQFQQAMLGIYLRAKSEADYKASVFLDMVISRGGLATARYLINLAIPRMAIRISTKEVAWI